MDAQEKIQELLRDPSQLIQKKPFTRGAEDIMDGVPPENTVYTGQTVPARLPHVCRRVVSQDQFIKELDPNCHTILFDDNIPSICVKFNDGQVQEQVFTKSAIPYQRIIKDKKLLHLTGLPMRFTLVDKKPTSRQEEDFVLFKQYWDLRNQDGMKTKMVDTALSYGDAGLLYYFDRHGHIKSRILSYSDGYVLCPHNDDNGDRLLESVYYRDGDTEYIDSYDDIFMYRSTYTVSEQDAAWKTVKVRHGFSEIPLITKRCKVAWDDVQNLIESYEVLYNIFNVVQKRWGWGMLYIKGRVSEKAKKIAGNIVLNDVNAEGGGDAKFLTAPSPQGMIDTLDNIHYRIQDGSGCTFILPKDIHTSSDTSGIAVQLTQQLDIQTAMQGVIEWQNVADKMVRLFKEGLAKELVSSDIQPSAVTDFADLHINASFDIWKPFSESEYNQMVTTMVNSGILSRKTGIETNTVSRPDEVERVRKEEKEKEEKERVAQEAAKQTEVIVEPNEE